MSSAEYSHFFSPKERKQAYSLLGLILVMAFLDLVGIALIMPRGAVLANSDFAQKYVSQRA